MIHALFDPSINARFWHRFVAWQDWHEYVKLKIHSEQQKQSVKDSVMRSLAFWAKIIRSTMVAFDQLPFCFQVQGLR